MPLFVRRGTFVYDGTHFQVQLDEKKPRDSYSRQKIPALRALLTAGGGDAAAGTSSSGARGSKSKDKPPAFYRSQLIHYGLKDLKTRDAAKKALLRAIEGSAKLVVPASISQIEQELKSEWKEKEAAADEEAEASSRRLREEMEARLRKRQAEYRASIEEITNIEIPATKQKTLLDLKKLSLRYEILARELESYTLHSNECFLHLSLSKGSSHLWGHFHLGLLDGWFRSTKLASTQVKPGTTITGLWRTEIETDDEEGVSPKNILSITFLGNNKLRGKIEATHRGAFSFVGRESTLDTLQPMWEWREHWKDVGDDARRARGGRKRAAPEVTSDTDGELDKSSEAGEREDVMERKAEAAALAAETFSEYDRNKRNKKAKGEKADRLIPSDLEGRYVIFSKGLDNWEAPYDGRVLTFGLSRGKSHLWGKFDFGLYTGYVRSEVLKSLPTSAGATISCHWRGEDAGSGEMTFEEEVNTMVITFLGGGKLTAEMGSEFGTFSLVGTKRLPSAGETEEVDVEDWKDSWKRYNIRSYAAASRSRWGGWGGDDSEQEQNSDSERGSEKPHEVVDFTGGAL